VRNFLAGLKRWYLRRFKGVVEPPAHAKGQGTTWQQHATRVQGFTCQCGTVLAFSEADYKILSQNHIEGCDGVFDQSTMTIAKGSSRVIDLTPCTCPVTEARYVKICPNCRRGHWKQANEKENR